MAIFALRPIVWSDGYSRPDDYYVIHEGKIVGQICRMNSVPKDRWCWSEIGPPAQGRPTGMEILPTRLPTKHGEKWDFDEVGGQARFRFVGHHSDSRRDPRPYSLCLSKYGGKDSRGDQLVCCDSGCFRSPTMVDSTSCCLGRPSIPRGGNQGHFAAPGTRTLKHSELSMNRAIVVQRSAGDASHPPVMLLGPSRCRSWAPGAS